MFCQTRNHLLAGTALAGVVCALAGGANSQAADQPLRWFKGNTHTHTWWSDGDSPPETVAKWYKEHGYNFLVLTDHNTVGDQEKLFVPVHKDPEKTKRLQQAAEAYEKSFGADWVEKRTNAKHQVEYRLKKLEEYRHLFDESGKFLLVPGEEISDAFEKRPVHVNAVNAKQVIKPQGGRSMVETIQNNIHAVIEQGRQTGQPILPHLNHPNFKWAITVDEIAGLREGDFFEVHNGHPGVANYGDTNHLGVERMWDVVLTRRLTDLNLPVMHGVATDDAHVYTAWGAGMANPGRAWVMVRARALTATEIVNSMKQGDFYATTGVVLDDVRCENNSLQLKIQARPGVSYTTQFIGTLRGYKGEANASNPNIGKVLAEIKGLVPSYKMTGQEVYVRAKVISDATHPNPSKAGDHEAAWAQPVCPK